MLVVAWAKHLGCSVRNVTARAERGTLPGRRVSGRWQFDPIEIAELTNVEEEPA